MSGITNPDNGMMENQQALDLGHAIDEDGGPSVKGASVESPIPSLTKGPDADGLIEPEQEMPDEATEEARAAALDNLRAQPHPRR